jgi:hypothetical protein
MEPRSRFLLCLALTCLGARVARADFQTTVTTPYPGVVHTRYADASLPLTINVVATDISSQEIHLYATQSDERGQTVSDFANCKKGVTGCVKSDVAINGDLFDPSGYVPAGLAWGGAKVWPDAASDNAVEGFFAFGRPMDLNAVQLSIPSDVAAPAASIAVVGAVGGRALLVSSGQPQMNFDPADPTEPFRAAPRAAVGLDANVRTLFLVAVDGDQPSSVGMTAEDLGAFLAGLGVSDALELDGGGSAALYVRKEGGVVSSPSDGVERLVANHLGISYGVSPYHFSVVGQVFDTNFGDMTRLINNANVVVDGVTAGWLNTHTLYQVNNVSPHYVCAHATAPGYKSATQCRQITIADVAPPGGTNIQYLSLVMYPGSDPPPDMAPPPDLARPLDGGARAFDLAGGRDGHAARDGGAIVEVGGCACALGGARRDPGHLSFIVVFLVAAARFRRRIKRTHD